MSERYDAIVVGLGAMGSAAAYHLAARGVRVLGLDRFAPPHGLGSAHGQSRIIREAYFEHPLYVPLVQRAYELWTQLGTAFGAQLLLPTGGLMIGPPDGVLVSGARRSAEEHGLPHETLSAGEVRRRFPALQPDESMSAIWEPRAGVLFPERCIDAQLGLARRNGAELRVTETVMSWRASGEGIEVITSAAVYRGEFLVLAAGAWTTALLSSLNLPLTVERQVQHWFEPQATGAMMDPAHLPIYAFEYEPERLFYGFPDLGRGAKVARHHQGQVTTAADLDRKVRADEQEAMRALVERFVPAANGALLRSDVCMYTNTPDGHFIIDRHPEHSNVVIVSACSGHGFKFAPAIGEIVGGLVCGDYERFDLTPFRLARFEPKKSV